ncbi:MAG: FAD-dependent oxidoreductase [Verrucomicrobiota bacterium]|nr:FAD-dependent oxidoreductase [Limisphaera sp.]MDW8382781.1 FAD-dependent oxidoreductase [Verrucomicrobiota bacterium]
MKPRVVIIGGGIIGLCTAWYCCRKGFEVWLLERFDQQRDGCSFGNAGMIVPSHFIPLAAPGMVALGLKWMWRPDSPFYIRPRWDRELIRWGLRFWRAANHRRIAQVAPLLRDLNLASRECFLELAALPGMDAGLVTKGILMLCQSEHGLAEEIKIAEQARALGLEAEVLDAAQVSRLNPGLSLNIHGAVLYPRDCHLVPERFMQGLQRLVQQAGVTCLWRAHVHSWAVSGARIRAVRLQNGREIAGDSFVLCAGVWSTELVRPLGLSLPMQAGKGYSLTLPAPAQHPQMGCICTEARVAVTPMNGSLRVGGTMELSGLDERVNPIRVQGIIRSFCRYFPAFAPSHFEGLQPWVGLRPCSPDGLPYLGRPRAWENLWVATGHAMMGLSLGPISGQILAQAIAGESPRRDLSLLAPDRYPST